MPVSMWTLFVALLYAVAFGAALHLLYDAVRVLRILCGVRYPGTVGERLHARPLPLLHGGKHESLVTPGAKKESSAARGAKKESSAARGAKKESSAARGAKKESSTARGAKKESSTAPGAKKESPAARGARWVQNGIIFITDVLFCLLAAALFSLFIYWQNDGAFRAVLLFGAVIGYALFHVTFGRLLLSFSTVVAFGCHALFAYTVCLLRFPLAVLCRAAAITGRWAVRLLRCLSGAVWERLILPRQSKRREDRRLAAAYRDLPP